MEAKEDQQQWRQTHPPIMLKEVAGTNTSRSQIVTVKGRYVVSVYEAKPNIRKEHTFIIQYLDTVRMKWNVCEELPDQTGSEYPPRWRLLGIGKTSTVAIVIHDNEYVYIWKIDILCNTKELHKLNVPCTTHIFGSERNAIIWIRAEPSRYLILHLIFAFFWGEISANIFNI